MGDKKTFFRREKKVFLSSFLKCITKSKCQQQKNLVFIFYFYFLVSVFPTNRTQEAKAQESIVN